MKARTIATLSPSGKRAGVKSERLVEAIATARAERGEAREILRRGLRIDHGREPGGVGSDDNVLAEAALQAQAGHAEVRILVGELEVAGVVGGLRNAPRNAEHGAVARSAAARPERLVCSSRLPAGARMTSEGIRYSNIEPDQEISAAPSAERRDGAAEPEPVARRNIAFGDGEEAREPRLRGEEVVAAWVELAVR